MEFKTLVAVFLALAFTIALASATSPALDSATVDLTLTPTNTVGYLRSKRQFYPGFGGGSSIANAQASSFSGGGGFGFPGSFSGASANANAGSFGGFGK